MLYERMLIRNIKCSKSESKWNPRTQPSSWVLLWGKHFAFILGFEIGQPSWCFPWLYHCCVRLFVTPWTLAHQAPLFMEFSRQEYWSGLPCSSPGELPDPGIKSELLTLQTDSLLSEPPGKPPQMNYLSSNPCLRVFFWEESHYDRTHTHARFWLM